MKYFPYFYKITIDRVLDGDTVEATFDLGFCVSLKVTVRLAGYDAPETFRPKTEREKDAGEKVKYYVRQMLGGYAGSLYCRSTKIDLYGRSTGILYVKDPTSGDYISLNEHFKDYIENMGYTKAELRKTLDEELDSWGPSA